MKWYCNNCNDESPTRYCPKCGSECVEVTASHPVTSPHNASPRAIPWPVEKQPEAPRKEQEGQQHPHPSEMHSQRNSRGRFFNRIPKKPLLIGTGALIVIIFAGLIWVILNRHEAPGVTSSTDIVIEKEAATPKPEEKKTVEDPTKTAASPNAPAKKVVKRAPAKTPKAQAPRNEPWKYRVESAPKPAPQAQAQAGKNPLGKLFDVFQGPAPDVTPPSNDPRDTGR